MDAIDAMDQLYISERLHLLNLLHLLILIRHHSIFLSFKFVFKLFLNLKDSKRDKLEISLVMIGYVRYFIYDKDTKKYREKERRGETTKESCSKKKFQFSLNE